MPDQIVTETRVKAVENSPATAVEAKDAQSACQIRARSWLKGGLGMAICCTAPLLLVAAVAFFGISLGALASGFLTVAALLACPVGMFLMMRMMMKHGKNEKE
ncbi:MAG: DUF2933 domain-containing protein [Candidatus Binatia bacterium]